MPTVADLGRQVKSKYPEYADIPDDELGLKIQAKHPGSYDDFSPAPVARPNVIETPTKAPWGVPSAGPHKSFAETVGPDSTLGKIATGIGDIAEYLPDEGAGLAVPAGAAIGTLAQRARNLAATVGSGAAVDWAAGKIGLPAYIAHPLGFATSIAVGTKLSPEIAEAMQEHGTGWFRKLLGERAGKSTATTPAPKFDPASSTATAGRKATVPPPPQSKPSDYFKISGTVNVPMAPPRAAGALTHSPWPPPPPGASGATAEVGPQIFTKDEIAKSLGKGKYASLDPKSAQAVDSLYAKQMPPPPGQSAAPAATPPAASSPSSTAGYGPVPQAPGHVPEHRREHYTKQADIGHSEALAKDTKIANFLKSSAGGNKTAADVLKMTDDELATVQRKLGYRPQSGSRSRSFEEFRKHLAAEMGMTPPPAGGTGPKVTPPSTGAGATNVEQSTAQAGQSGASSPIQRPTGTEAPTIGATTSVKIPGEKTSLPAKYALRELDDIQTSHSGITFQKNPHYTLVNDRDYRNPDNQAKVLNNASPEFWDSRYHITDNPDATNGPVVIDSAGNALGGNGRGMMLQRVYKYHPKGAEEYKSLLEQKAAQFGIDPKQVRLMKQPVLVREVADEAVANSSKAQASITDLNKTGTASLRPAERSIADSRRVSQGTLDHVAARLEAEGGASTLSDILNGKPGAEVLNRLIADGVITPQERAGYASGDALTDAGRERISKLLVGRFFRDPAQMDRMPALVRNRLEHIAAPLARVEGYPEWNLTPKIQDSLDLLEQAKLHNAKTLDDFVKQNGLFGGEQYPPDVVSMAKALQKMPMTQLRQAVHQYSQDAQFAMGGESLFGEVPTPLQSFQEAFGMLPIPPPPQ